MCSPANELGITLVGCVQAFFIQTDEELHRWVQTNPQYSKEQHMQLGAAIADFRGLKRKEKAILLGQIETCIL